MNESRRSFISNSAKAAVGLTVLPTFASLLQGCKKDTIEGPQGDWLALANSIQGSLVMQGDLDFARLNTQFALAYLSEIPQAIALCKSEADVIACVKWANVHKVPIAPRSGGHSYAGFSRTIGLLIDLSQMNSVSYDASSGLATLEGGAHNQEVYRAGREAGVSITHGRCKGVGVAGLVMGGGIGFNMRNKGLTCDGLVSTRIVLANGDVINVSETENQEVFWAIRGAGGGNFGINTQFVMRMFPITTVTWFKIQWRANNTILKQLFDAFQEIAVNAPPELGVKFMLNVHQERGQNRLYLEILGQYAGSRAALVSLFQPLFSIALPTYEVIQNLPYWDAQEHLSETGNPEYSHERSRFAFGKISTDGRDAIFRNLMNWPGTSVDAMWKYFLMGGRISDVSSNETAFLFRNASMITSIDLEWIKGDEKNLKPNLDWLDAFHDEMEQYTSAHCFINFIDRRQRNHLNAYYGEHLNRLRAVKRQLDPKNVFANPQSIPL